MFNFKSNEKTVEYEPYTAPNGVVIAGPMADHMRAMVGIGRAFDPINYDKKLAMEFANKPIEKSEAPVAPTISNDEKEAIITASIVKTESEAKSDSEKSDAAVDLLCEAVFGKEDSDKPESNTTDKPKSNPNARGQK